MTFLSQLLVSVSKLLHVGSDWGTLFFSAFGVVYLYLILKGNKTIPITTKIVVWFDVLLITVLYYLYDFLGMTSATHTLIATGFNIATAANIAALILLSNLKNKDN
jgi:hypothetical protein